MPKLGLFMAATLLSAATGAQAADVLYVSGPGTNLAGLGVQSSPFAGAVSTSAFGSEDDDDLGGFIPLLGASAAGISGAMKSSSQSQQSAISRPVVEPQSPDLVSAASEPATWLLMILGFGSVGYALRRRRRKEQSLNVVPRFG